MINEPGEVDEKAFDRLKVNKKKSCLSCPVKCRPATRLINNIDEGGNPWIYYRALDFLFGVCQGKKGSKP